MMNKGLELIEARWLFAARPDQIDVVVQPQSVIHSMVRYVDGSILAQLGNPDMRTPIAHALAWPRRVDAGVEALDLVKIARLDFRRPDLDRFPCLRLSQQVLREGGTACAVLSAANEVAVQAFLERRLLFTDIANVIEEVLGRVRTVQGADLDQVLDCDREARRWAHELVEGTRGRRSG
jgi:1-deoxy-D-xylulose-5-phosphate reductoisomerase